MEFPLLFVLFFSPFGLGFSKAQFEGEVDPVQCRDRITIEAEGEKWSDSRDNSVRIYVMRILRDRISCGFVAFKLAWLKFKSRNGNGFQFQTFFGTRVPA